jgi:hypothetical protein
MRTETSTTYTDRGEPSDLHHLPRTRRLPEAEETAASAGDDRITSSSLFQL